MKIFRGDFSLLRSINMKIFRDDFSLLRSISMKIFRGDFSLLRSSNMRYSEMIFLCYVTDFSYFSLKIDFRKLQETVMISNDR
jgi:hypothetical protein